MALPLRTAAFWTVYRVLDRAPVMQQPAHRVRAKSNLRNRLFRLPVAWLITGRPDPSVAIADSKLCLADGTELPLRVYRPREQGAEPRPVILNFHGGGWVSGDARQSEWWCAGVAAGAQAVVVSVEYRLAPEHPYPTPPEDCYAATNWVVEHAGELGVDASRLAVMGDSAGGNLAAVVCLMARDRGGPPIALQVLVYPSVALGTDFPSKFENANAPIITAKDLENTPRLYLDGTGADIDDPYVSPLYANHHNLPPALIQTAQYDPLRDHGAAYAAALRGAGVEVRHTNYVDAVHGYASLPNIAPAARQALAEAVITIRERL
ncbi:MAG TPA: alpha/beta hydrolase [Jatrophihabitans sp.]|nr:alpha/beta hydrolase [Jatrophihabitans sp.]